MTALPTDLLAMTDAIAGVLARADRGEPGDGPADEPNTYGLPKGADLLAGLREWFGRQRAAVLGTVAPGAAHLPGAMPPMTDWTGRMAEAMTPVLSVYWDEAGKATREHLGLDPDEWRVTSPHLRGRIHAAAYDFCEATNRTTSRKLDDALRLLHSTMAAGQADRGETLDQLAKRVNAVFDQADAWRARRIAATEASRAVHAAQEMAAAESGVVQGFELLLSADACPLCRKVATECKAVRVGQPFAVVGDNPTYRDVKHPPLHPGCQCTMVEVLTPEAGGPPASEVPWGRTLDQPQRGLDDGYAPPEGKAVPEPEPDRPRPTPNPES